MCSIGRLAGLEEDVERAKDYVTREHYRSRFEVVSSAVESYGSTPLFSLALWFTYYMQPKTLCSCGISRKFLPEIGLVG